MKLHLTSAQNKHLVTGYGLDKDRPFVEINRQRYTTSLIVSPDELILDWPVTHFADLTQAHLAYMMNLKPEVVLLGTGEKHQFLHPKVFQPLTHNGITLECMTTAAACRTYNILMSEGRAVVAALLI